jgi:DNA-binding beta-propeller fold protein YncE
VTVEGAECGIYVADSSNNRVQVFNSSGVFQSTFGSFGSGNGQFISPSGIAVGSGGSIYVTDNNNDRVQVFSPTSPPPVSTREPSGIIGLGILGGGLVVRRLAKRR